MDSLLKLISIAAAACVAGSAAFIFGKLTGMHHTDLAWYMTLSDLINYAPATLIVFGFAVIINLFTVKNFDMGIERFKRPGGNPGCIRALIISVVVLAIFIPLAIWRGYVTYQAVALCLFFIVLVGYVSTFTVAFTRTTLGDFAAQVFDKFLVSIASLVIIGYVAGTSAMESRTNYQVCTTNGLVSASTIMPIDRGVIIVRVAGFQFIPWAEVKSVESAPAKPIRKNAPSVPGADTTKACIG